MPVRTKFLNNKAFTLIELLIVIAIIAILTALIAFSYTTLQRNARDTQRKNDLQTIAGALQRFYSDNSNFPNNSGGYMIWNKSNCSYTISPLSNLNVAKWGGGTISGYFVDGIKCTSSGNFKTYIKSVPGDPLTTPQYCYTNTSPQNYTLYAKLEGSGNVNPATTTCNGLSGVYNYQVTPND